MLHENKFEELDRHLEYIESHIDNVNDATPLGILRLTFLSKSKLPNWESLLEASYTEYDKRGKSFHSTKRIKRKPYDHYS